MNTASRPLLDVLGARWRVGVPAVAAAWDRDGAFAGFALGDGGLALAPGGWEGAPTVRAREGGGTELVPGTAAAPAIARASVHQGACLSVAGDPDAGFLTAGADGVVARVRVDGQFISLAKGTMVASGPGGWRVFAGGRAVQRVGGAAVEVGGEVSSMAVDPSGARVAVAREGGVTVWAGGDTPRVLPAPGRPVGVAWNADGSWLASFDPDGIVRAWRNSETATRKFEDPVRALNGLGNDFVVGAGGRIWCWSPAVDRVEPCGVANQTAVTRLACHPRRQLIAAGYGNGAVVLCQPGRSELLFIRGAGEGAVSALALSPNGDRLGIGTEGGEIAVLALPDMLFRENKRAQ